MARVEVKLVPRTLAEMKTAMERFAQVMRYNLRDVALGQGALLAQDSAIFSPPFPPGGGRGLSKQAEKAGKKAVQRDVNRVVVGADDTKGTAPVLTAMRLVGAVKYGNFGAFQQLRGSAALKSTKGNNSVFQKILNDADDVRAFEKARNFFNRAKTSTNAFGRVEANATDVPSVHQPIKQKYSGRIWKNKGPGFPWYSKYVVESNGAVQAYIDEQQQRVGLLKSGWWAVVQKIPRPRTKTGGTKAFGMGGWLPWVKRHPSYGAVVFKDDGKTAQLIITNLIGDSDGAASDVEGGGVPAIAIGNRVKQMEAEMVRRLALAAKAFEK